MNIRRIMIVDDNQEFLDEIGEALRTKGYAVHGLSDETLAVERARDLKPDLLLMDIKMREKTGLQVAVEMSGQPETAGIPIIIMSGYYTRDEVKRFEKLAIVKECVVKPLNLDELVRKIQALERSAS